jgi:hypothetical protein
VLPQFKKLSSPPVHQFLVFSIIDDSDKVKPKFVQCPNCGIIHKVTEIAKSEILSGKEDMNSIVKIEDIAVSLPEQLVTILEGNKADLPTWEAAAYALENKLWGTFVVLTSDSDGDTKQGKYVRLLGERMFKVESFIREETIK